MLLFLVHSLFPSFALLIETMYYYIAKNQPYYSTLMSLSFLGLYPRSSETSSLNISLAATIGTIILAFIICNVGGIGHLIVSFKGKQLIMIITPCSILL